MSKDSFIEYDSTAANNTDVGGVSMAEGTAPSNINDGIRELMSHLANYVKDQGGTLDLAGTADVITVTASQTLAAYADGFYIVGKASGDNTTVVTLNVNSLGAKKVQKNVAGVETALAAGDIQGGGFYGFRYDPDIDSSAGGFWLEDLNFSTLLANLVEDTTPQLGGSLDTNAKSVEWSKGADVASAAELLVLRDGNSFDVTGTTTITSIETTADAWKIGSFIMLQFDGALTLTHHATDLILPGAANITTAAGDTAIFQKYAAGDWRCVSYQVAANAPGAGGVWELISTATASNDATIEFNNLSSTHVKYQVVFECQPATDNVGLFFRTSTDNGSTFDSGASDYAYFGASDGAAPTTAAYILLTLPGGTYDIGNQANERLWGTIEIQSHADGHRTMVFSTVIYANEITTYVHMESGGFRADTINVDAIQFLMSSGNISSGVFRLYGLKAS